MDVRWIGLCMSLRCLNGNKHGGTSSEGASFDLWHAPPLQKQESGIAFAHKTLSQKDKSFAMARRTMRILANNRFVAQILWVVVLACASYTDATTGTSLDYGIAEWIENSDGGYFNPAQSIREIDGDSSKLGVFANTAIKKGTVLARIPWSLVVKSDNPKELGYMTCSMVRTLAREMKLGKDSAFAPFMEYVNHRPTTGLPSSWSAAGRELFQQVVGGTAVDPIIPPFEPASWLEYDWYEMCEGDRSDELSAKAALLVVELNDDGVLVPGLNFYRHRNGKWNNAESEAKPFRDVVIRSTRRINEGDEIHISLNLCHDCGNRESGYGTAEIFRDYGFLEDFPQRWHYHEIDCQFDINHNMNGDLTLKWDKYNKPTNEESRRETVAWMRGQIRRLLRLENVYYKDGNPGIPDSEWKMAWNFQRANVQALSIAIEAIETKLDETFPKYDSYYVSETGADSQTPHYDLLDVEFDELDYKAETCRNEEAMDFAHHRHIETIQTPYQQMKFEIEPETKDVVLELDRVIQIASIYRPQYHEFVVHAAARYIDTVKRAIFIGGGDSMLLHELLKYPSLEFVVGLELDQMVTRKSFQYFHTQPHFDDPRVEWWFGDATKSLLLLPKEYWQSFDLVLVDLSETVMSFSVTKELDVFDALALLLTPEGILVKNEQYLGPVSQAFDHSIHIVYECPIICDQVLTMGSNRVDFMHSPVKDHGIPNLLYGPLDTFENRYDLLHDYRKNDARAQGKCKDPSDSRSNNETEPTEQEKSAGIMAILDLEGSKVTGDDAVSKVLGDALSKNDFGVVVAPSTSDGITTVVMKEGYIVARCSKEFCSLDVNLWGKFANLSSLTDDIVEAMQSETVSSFRVVVGGMYGSSSWVDDKAMIGPQIVQNRNCDGPSNLEEKTADTPTPEDLVKLAVRQTVEHAVFADSDEETLAVAICGPAEEKCLAAHLLEESTKVGRVLRLSSCKDLTASPASMYDCEASIVEEWQTASEAHGATGLILVDGTAPYELLQILHSILDENEVRESLMNTNTNAVLAWSYDEALALHSRNFLDRYRKQHRDDPISRGHYLLKSSTDVVHFGIVLAGDDRVAYRLALVEAEIQKDLEEQPGASVELTTVYGGKYPWLEPWEPKTFLQSDYDNEPGLQQYFEQSPIAHHVVYQFELDPTKPGQGNLQGLSTAIVESSLEKAFASVQWACPNPIRRDDLGEGLTILCLNPAPTSKGSSVVLVWDGRNHVDVSIYFVGTSDDAPVQALRQALLATAPNLSGSLQDAMPRGPGRTITTAADLKTPKELESFFQGLSQHPTKAALEELERKREEEEDDEDDDDYQHEEL